MGDVREALEPCPFCGGEANDTGHIRYSKPLADTWWDDDTPITEAFFVNCIKCGAVSRGSIVPGYQTKAEAIAAWNTRFHPPAGDAVIERVARAICAEETGGPLGYFPDGSPMRSGGVWNEYDDRQHGEWRALARAALNAIQDTVSHDPD